MEKGTIRKRLKGKDLQAVIIGKVEYDPERSCFRVVKFDESKDASELEENDVVDFYPGWEGSSFQIFSGTITSIKPDSASEGMIYTFKKSRF